MKKIHYLLGIALLFVGMPASAQVSNDNEDEVYKVDRPQAKDFVPGQVLFKLKDGQQATVRRAGGQTTAGISSLDKVLKEYAVQEMEQLLPNAKVKGTPRRAKAYNGQTIVERDLTQLYKVTLPEEKVMQTLQLVDELKALPEVEFAEPNYKMYIMADDHIADNYEGNPMSTEKQQWYLYNYGVTQLWDKPIINPTRPVIAIIDTGVDMTHPDLVDNLWTNQAEAEGESDYDNDGNGFKGDVHGWDFINNTPNIRDNNMHGTHVAGIAAACNNDIGIIGANPRALIMPVSVMQSDGTGDVATVVKGINYAVANGATVLNLSLGTYANSSTMRQALEQAYQKAVIVAAAGNDRLFNDRECGLLPCPMFPAAYSFVLGIQASTQSGSLAGFSNYDCNGPNYSSESTVKDPDGYNYEMKAPGVDILSTIPGGHYKALNGTSMACPLAAGAISALMMVKDYSKDDGINQEVLWGDLTHTDNIAEAYDIKNQPAELDIVNMQFQNRKDLDDETEEDYSNDHEIDHGETVSIYPVIRTTFGEASNIKMHLEMGDEFEDPNTVEIYSDSEHKVDFGWHLDAYGRNVSQNPLVFKVGENVPDARHIKMKLVAACDGSTETVEKPFTIVVTNMVKINGLISVDRTLIADHVYYVNDNLAITEGTTLTIEPGTRLEFAENTALNSFGKLDANGTPEKPIIFTRHTGEGDWNGIYSHRSKGETDYSGLYTNDERTLYTILPTDQTPIKISVDSKRVYYSSTDETPNKHFYIEDYLGEIYSGSGRVDLTLYQDRLTDPTFITPIVQQMINDWDQYCNMYSSVSTEDKTNYQNIGIYYSNKGWAVYSNPRDRISYCRIDNFKKQRDTEPLPIMKDCIIKNSSNYYVLYDLEGVRNVIQDCIYLGSTNSNLKYSNIINNNLVNSGSSMPKYSDLYCDNYFNNAFIYNSPGKYKGNEYWLQFYSKTPQEDKAENPSYLGTSRKDIVRPHIWEMGNCPDALYGVTNLDNMPSCPFAEAHGIVWKVVVNGYDAQDEYEELPPLGVGKHKFEVYFNRPMNKNVAPQISFGVRDPWTQQAVTEEGEDFGWNADGTIYTAYKTITGKTKSDGVNRIYVYGAEDNEYFEIPYEKSRFNINVQAAGSMATGFMAEAGMGKVNLTWDNSHNDFEDAMGFNIYRYTLDADGNEVNNTRINTDIVDIETTVFTDYDVTPGETYYYLYKVLSTDLQEYDVSNVVAATPLTSELGDANGSGNVDVADVITTVNYAAGMDPKPFIFEAADMNTDKNIDILDVVGIIQKILHPTAAPVMTMNEAQAIYTIENGVLYVESPVALAGVQALVNSQHPSSDTQHQVSTDLDGFEHVTAWLSENDMLFLAYNMNGKTLTPGKHALLYLGDADVTQIRLSDTQGHNVEVVAGEGTTAIDNMGSKVQLQGGVYNLKGQKVSGKVSDLQKLPKGVYIVNGEKVVK